MSLSAHEATQAFIMGNSILGASFITYAGALTPEDRAETIKEWFLALKAMGIEYQQ